MSDMSFLAQSDTALIAAILSALRSDAQVQSVFGHPARLYDDEARAPAYPYAVLEQHESDLADLVSKRGLAHTIVLAAYTRHGGIETAKSVLGVLRGAIERLSLSLPSQRVVLVLPTYCDVLRTKAPHILRGVLRIRVQTEEL